MSVYNVDAATAKRPASVASSERYSRADSGDSFVVVAAAPQSCETLPVFKASHKLSWSECIFQIFFSIQGPIFFYLPYGFKSVGYLPGIAATIVVALFYAYTMYMYFEAEERIRKKFEYRINDDTNISIGALIDYALLATPATRTLAKYLKVYLKYEIILCFSLNLSFNHLFISQNIVIIVQYLGYTASTRAVLVGLFPVTTLFALVPDLKVMSLIAYATTAAFIGIVFEVLYFIYSNTAPQPSVEMVGDLTQLPSFVSVLFLTLTCTPILFQLKQEMKNRRHFSSLFGSLNVSIFIVVLLNVCFSLIVYLRYGDRTQTNVMQNLPPNVTVILSNVLLTTTLICSNAIMFFVIFETLWCGSLEKIVSASRHKRLYEYFARTTINLFITIAAIAIPTFDLLINLATVFSCPYDSLFLPVLLYSVTEWDTDKRNGKRLFFVTVQGVLFFAIGIIFCAVTLWSFVSEFLSFYNVPINW